MKQLISIFLIAHCLFANAQNKVDYKSFFAKQDMVFDSLSVNWEEGAFLGNGLLGVMVYKEDASAIRFDLGRTDVVDHREGMNPSIGRARLPIGRFVLRTTAPIKKVQLRLSLWNAELTGSILTDKGEIKLQTIVPATKDVIILATSGDEKLGSLEWYPEPAQSPFLSLGRDSISKYPSNPAATHTKENGINFHYQPLLIGGSYTTAWKQIKTGNQQTYFITIANSYPANTSRQLAKQTLSPLVAKDVNALTASHRNYWHRLLSKKFYLHS